jgi:hypothetical protein
VSLLSETAATVDGAGGPYAVELAARAEHVHAVARARDVGGSTVYSAVARLGAGEAARTPSAAVRRVTVTTLAHLLDVPESDLAIDRDGRVPSHHGRFVAFACRWQPA